MSRQGFNKLVAQYSIVGHVANDASPSRVTSNQIIRPFVPVHLRYDVVLKVHRNEDNLGTGGLGHILKRLQLPDLHSRWRSQDIGSLPHEPSRIYLRAGSDDLRFTDPLLLRGRGKRVGNLRGEDDILDEDALDGDTPFVSGVANDFCDFEGDCFTLGHDVLDSTCADNMTKGGLSTLDESLAKVRDTEGRTIWVDDLEVDDRVAVRDDLVRGPDECIGLYTHRDIDIVPGDDLLHTDRNDSDLDVHGAKGLGTDVNLDQPWIHRLVELSKSLDKSD